MTIESAGRATEPLQIDLIVDDNGTGLFRAPLARFVQRMEGRAVMALRSVVGQTMKVVEFTPSVDALMRGIATLNARPETPDGGQLLEGISEAAIELHKVEARRPVIIALTVGGQEHSTVSSDFVLDQLRKSGASLHVFSVAGSALRASVVAKTPKDLLQENMHLNRVLGDGPKQTGGRHQQIVASAGALTGAADPGVGADVAVPHHLHPAVRGQAIGEAVDRGAAEGSRGARAGEAATTPDGRIR